MVTSFSQRCSNSIGGVLYFMVLLWSFFSYSAVSWDGQWFKPYFSSFLQLWYQGFLSVCNQKPQRIFALSLSVILPGLYSHEFLANYKPYFLQRFHCSIAETIVMLFIVSLSGFIAGSDHVVVSSFVLQNWHLLLSLFFWNLAFIFFNLTACSCAARMSPSISFLKRLFWSQFQVFSLPTLFSMLFTYCPCKCFTFQLSKRVWSHYSLVSVTLNKCATDFN